MNTKGIRCNLKWLVLIIPNTLMEGYFHTSDYVIRYRLIGQGNCIVLLHGYLENIEIWNDFAEGLSASYQVLTFDIPKHGESESLSDCCTIDDLARSVNATLEKLKIDSAVIIGHSMGGYVALSFAELYPSKTAGLGLFHSTPFPDSDLKKRDRMLEVERVIDGELKSIVDSAVPMRFAQKNLSKYQKEVEWASAMAMRTSIDGVVSALKAMASRPDRNHVIEDASFPTMMIFGACDNHIPLDVANDLANRHKKTRTVFLNNSGHMGFVEERDQALLATISFLEYVFS